jgi:hypothetical protein
MFDDEEQKHGTEEKVVGLNQIARPDFGGMVGQESRPTLAVMLRRQLASGLPHMVPDGSSIHPNAEFQQLTANAFCPPAPMV